MQEEHIVKIFSITPVTHNVNRYKVQKPDNYSFIPGQATEVAVNKPHWREERRPFTFTGLNEWDHLEFTIKSYSDHDGVTNQLLSLKPGDEFLLHDVWGAIQYKGPGVFIAGGAGVTPFIAILRDLEKNNQLEDNTLIFANKSRKDIILHDDFQRMLKSRFINILSDEETDEFAHGHIDDVFLAKYIKDFSQNFYICGPPAMIDAVQASLLRLGAGENAIVIEL